MLDFSILLFTVRWLLTEILRQFQEPFENTLIRLGQRSFPDNRSGIEESPDIRLRGNIS
jgi:hypothetical protein